MCSHLGIKHSRQRNSKCKDSQTGAELLSQEQIKHQSVWNMVRKAESAKRWTQEKVHKGSCIQNKKHSKSLETDQ